MRLHIYEHCPFCSRARLAFGLKNVPVELSVIMEGDAETPYRMIGKKAVPILEKDDGSYLGESLDIVRFVDRLDVPILDGPSDLALDAWSTEVWPLATKLFIPRFTKSDFAELSTSEARESYRLREQRAFGDLDELMSNTPALVTQMLPKMEALALLLENRRTVGISDIKLWPILRSLSIVKDLTFPVHVRTYAESLSLKGNVPLMFHQSM